MTTNTAFTFGDVHLNVFGVYAFNGHMTCLYENPAAGDNDRTVVLLDASGSMSNKQNEMKLLVSALKCMSDTQGKFNLPTPKGQTGLVDAVDEVIKLPNVQRIMVVSDGDDNASKNQIIECITDDVPKMADLPSLIPNFAGEDTKATRRDAVAKHMNYLGIELFVVGVGREVKHFINACASSTLKINTAVVDFNATAEEVGSIMSTVVRRAKSRSTDRAVVTAANADALSAPEVDKVKTESHLTTSASERSRNVRSVNDGPPFDSEKQMAYIRYIVEHQCTKGDVCLPAESVEAIVFWFRSFVLSQGGAPVAIDLVKGRLYPIDKYGHRNGAVFDLPVDDVKASVWSNTLGRVIELLAREPCWITAKVDGLGDAFAAEIAANRVGPVFCDVGTPASFCAVTKDHLGQLGATDVVGERCLYYKFKENTYDHVIVNHRMAGIGDFVPLAAKSLRVVHRGNSGAKSYGGPIISLAPPKANAKITTNTEVSSELDPDSTAMDTELLSDAGGPSSPIPFGSLKRKLADLEAENEQLKAKIATLERAVVA